MGCCKGPEFTINWGGSYANGIKAIATDGGCSLGWVETALSLATSNVTINCTELASCKDLLPCKPSFINIQFNQGCNAAIAL